MRSRHRIRRRSKEHHYSGKGWTIWETRARGRLSSCLGKGHGVYLLWDFIFGGVPTYFSSLFLNSEMEAAEIRKQT